MGRHLGSRPGCGSYTALPCQRRLGACGLRGSSSGEVDPAFSTTPCTPGHCRWVDDWTAETEVGSGHLPQALLAPSLPERQSRPGTGVRGPGGTPSLSSSRLRVLTAGPREPVSSAPLTPQGHREPGYGVGSSGASVPGKINPPEFEPLGQHLWRRLSVPNGASPVEIWICRGQGCLRQSL